MIPVPFLDLKRQEKSCARSIETALRNVLKTGQFILGPEVKQFETAFAHYCQTKEAVGVSSGSSALRLALMALGVNTGDEVITTPFTFIATSEAITQAGGKVVFADIDRSTLTLDPAAVEKALTPKTKGIVAVHLYGQPCAMNELSALAKSRGLFILEDAAQAHGALYQGKKTGSLSEAGCFSFFPTKNLGGYGDGGMVVTSNPALAEKIRLLRNHGRTAHYEHSIEGYNERLDSLQAAVLSIKLKFLDRWNSERRAWASFYRSELKGTGLQWTEEPRGTKNVYHLFSVRTTHRRALQEHLSKSGIATAVHYPIPLHLQPAYRWLGYRPGEFPMAEEAANTILCLPVFPGLTKKEALRVVQAIRQFCE